MKSGGWMNNKIGNTPAIFPRKNRKGQVTLFIIIAVLIVAAAFLIYSFYPQIKSSLGLQASNPAGEIQSCIQNDIKDTIKKISNQGGSVTPELYYTFDNVKIEYLCYTDKNKARGVVQQPMLKEHMESEIKNAIQNKVDVCFNSLKESYEKKGYSVNLNGEKEDISINILPKRIISVFNYSLSLSKGQLENYDSFSVVLNNNLYDLVAIANNIIEWEAHYGQANINMYMSYYPDIKVVENPRDDGTHIYVVQDRKTKDIFQFASRSLVASTGGGI